MGYHAEILWTILTNFKIKFITVSIRKRPFPSSPLKVPLTLFTCSFRTLHIRLRFGNRPLSAAVSFMASLIFPQPLFWYVYPVLLLLSFYPTARLVEHGLRSLQAVIPINQVYDVFISADVEFLNEEYPQQDERSSETQDLETNIGAQQV
uniref:Uncharacterized protein n=1 Tax=Vitis vinifera TaxID=29760 RepID=A5C0M3_VITVI|nr:hypothetical protein VITISV_020393 [Vitis vinifera]